MLRRIFGRVKPSRDDPSRNQEPPAIDMDRTGVDVLGALNDEAAAYNRGELKPTEPMDVPPLGALPDQEAEDAASLEAGRRLFAGEGPHPTFADFAADPTRSLSDREEAFHQRISDEHQESMTDWNTPGRSALLYLLVFKFDGGWAEEDYETFDRLMDELRAAAAAHPTGTDGQVPDPVVLANGRVYRFMVKVGCG